MAFGSEVLFIVICLNQEDFRMKHNPYSSSQRRTPWDGKKDLSPVQAFIRSEYLDTWHRHHPLLRETDEAAFLNLLEVDCCRYCGSVGFKKNGYTFNGIQRYRCKDCSRTFTVLSNTLFDSHKVSIIEWIEYLLNLFGYVSFHSTSRNSRIADSTVKYWLFKLFEILKHYQDDIVLSGDVYIDETFCRAAKKDLVKNKGRTYQGGNNQYCIGIGCDQTKVYCKIEGLDELKAWTQTTKELSNPALEAEVNRTGSAVLAKALSWSKAVNASIAALPWEVKKAFPGVREGFLAVKDFADIAIVSAANRDAVEEEWERFGLLELVDVMMCQDVGSKAACIKAMLEKGFAPDHVLMCGDAPGDLDAAKKNGVFFYPILTRHEAASWEEFPEAAGKLKDGTYAPYGVKKAEEFVSNLSNG